jgi:hypothetical protein
VINEDGAEDYNCLHNFIHIGSNLALSCKHLFDNLSVLLLYSENGVIVNFLLLAKIFTTNDDPSSSQKMSEKLINTLKQTLLLISFSNRPGQDPLPRLSLQSS